MSTPDPMYTRLRAQVEHGVELIENAMRDGTIDGGEQAAIYAHYKATLSLSEEHEATSKLAMALQHGGFTRRVYYAAHEYDAIYGTGELTPQVRSA